MTPLGIIVSALFIPWLAGRFGAMRLGLACALATAAIYVITEAMASTALGAFALMWGLGGIGGPPLTGKAMDTIDVNGLPLILFLAFCVLLAALAQPVPALSHP